MKLRVLWSKFILVASTCFCCFFEAGATQGYFRTIEEGDKIFVRSKKKLDFNGKNKSMKVKGLFGGHNFTQTLHGQTFKYSVYLHGSLRSGTLPYVPKGTSLEFEFIESKPNIINPLFDIYHPELYSADYDGPTIEDSVNGTILVFMVYGHDSIRKVELNLFEPSGFRNGRVIHFYPKIIQLMAMFMGNYFNLNYCEMTEHYTGHNTCDLIQGREIPSFNSVY